MDIKATVTGCRCGTTDGHQFVVERAGVVVRDEWHPVTSAFEINEKLAIVVSEAVFMERTS